MAVFFLLRQCIHNTMHMKYICENMVSQINTKRYIFIHSPYIFDIFVGTSQQKLTVCSIVTSALLSITWL